MNGKDWEAVELLGPPPAGENWFPVGRWQCREGHIEIGGITVGRGSLTNCSMCGKVLVRVHAAWIQGEPLIAPRTER